MKNIHGWTLVVFYLTAAAVLWFVATIAPDVNVWLKEQQHLSGCGQQGSYL